MKTILETDQDFICDIQAPCFQMLSSEEVELVRASKTQILFRKGDNLTKQGADKFHIQSLDNQPEKVDEENPDRNAEGSSSPDKTVQLVEYGRYHYYVNNIEDGDFKH
jgi:CRP/FNR family transcriptional regulator